MPLFQFVGVTGGENLTWLRARSGSKSRRMTSCGEPNDASEIRTSQPKASVGTMARKNCHFAGSTPLRTTVVLSNSMGSAVSGRAISIKLRREFVGLYTQTYQ